MAPEVVELLGCASIRQVQKILEPTDEEMVDLLALRMVSGVSKDSEAVRTFLGVEDAHLVFDREDTENFNQVRNQERSRVNGHRAFTAAWTERSNRVRPAPPAPKAKAKGGGKGRGRGGKGGGAAAEKVLPMGDLTQPMLRDLVPEGGHIWRGNQSGT